MAQLLPTKIDNYSRWDGGIADYDKDGQANEYAFGRSIDHRTNPRQLTLLPKTAKESGSLITALPKWAERVVNTTYIYDASGNIYSRSSAGSYSLLRSVANSHGNGMAYFGEDDNLYYALDKTIGRYGYIQNGTPSFADDFLGSQGGVPTNTNSLTLASASSQYATAADSTTLSITGNLTMEIYFNPTSLPTVGNSMTLMGKWDESGTTRSYKFDIYAISGYFGDGSNGALTISADTTDSPIDSACTGTSGAFTLSATNASFASGQIIFIHQTQGTGHGTWQRNKIIGYTAGTITLETALNANYTTGAQVIVMKQYTNVTINSGKTWTAKAWNGTTGGILVFLANGTINVNGTITAAGRGFRGGSGGSNVSGTQGEGYSGTGTQSTSANASGGGAGHGGTYFGGGGGAGGGHQSAGSNGGGAGTNGSGGVGGVAPGDTTDLTTMDFGGAGGGGGAYYAGSGGGNGGNGGGIIVITGVTINLNSGASVTTAGSNGSNAVASGDSGGGGGGAGGAVLLKAQTATLATYLSAAGGSGGGFNGSGGTGGAGSVGRMHIDYYTSVSYTSSTPTLDQTQDNTLVTTTSYQLRLGVSSDGTSGNSEYLTRTISSGVTTGSWHHAAVSWVASTSVATFYFDKVNIGTSTGTKTAIHDNASLFYVGANKGSSVVQNFFNGKIDEVRLWNLNRSDSNIANNADRELSGSEGGLVAYFQLDSSASDSTSNANNLTLVNTPSYTTDVPFANATTRLDIDQQDTSTGNTYTVPTSIDEGASARQTFVPAKDPQKSIDVKISAKGTGNWTLTVHDGLNRTIATVTATNSQLPSSGYYEFVFSSAWRPVRGASYHFHLTSTVNDGSVVSGTGGSLETGNFNSYFQFLVNDVDYHPVQQFLNKLVIGNERYLATWDASSYNPHTLVFPSGWRVRCLAQWNEYLAIGCWKGSNIYDYDEGIIFFWDGYSSTYNFYIKVPEGGVNAMLASRGVLYVWAGYQGDMLTYIGGQSADQVKRVPKMTINNYLEVMPGAVSMWQSLLRIGVSGNSDSTDVERGVYTYGQRNTTKPKSFTYDYPVSTGSRDSNVRVGMVYPVDRKLLVGWQDGTSYGVDVVDPAGNPFASGTVEMLIHDYGGVYHEKSAQVVRADFLPLQTGESITVKYKLDRSDDWTSLATSTVGDSKIRLPIDFGGHKEVQIAADLAQTNNTSPTLLELTLEENLNPGDTIV